MNLIYDNLIKILLAKFPELQGQYEENKDYLANLPHLFFENILVPYIENLSTSSVNYDKLNHIFEFLEQMLLSNNEKIREVAIVSVLEPLLPERQIVKNVKPYFGPMTSSYFDKLEKAYGWVR